MPKISVIVPVYKVEPYIHRCVDSILAQTFTDFELILVDDGSPDNCGAICDEYAEKDSRVRVIHQENGGLSAARNAGLDWAFANSDSEWIYFADSDDWIVPYALEVLMRGAETTGLSVIIGGHVRTSGEDPTVDTARLEPEIWDTEAYFCRKDVNVVVAWGKLYRKESFRTVRYPVGKIHEDVFTTYKLLFQYDRVALIDQPLYAYFQNADGIMLVDWTPRRLDAVEAQEERACYFLERGNDRMYHRSLRSIFHTLLWHIDLVRAGDPEKKKQYYRLLKRTIAAKYKKYRTALTPEERWQIKKAIVIAKYPGLTRCCVTVKHLVMKQ